MDVPKWMALLEITKETVPRQQKYTLPQIRTASPRMFFFVALLIYQADCPNSWNLLQLSREIFPPQKHVSCLQHGSGTINRSLCWRQRGKQRPCQCLPRSWITAVVKHQVAFDFTDLMCYEKLKVSCWENFYLYSAIYFLYRW